MELSPEDALRLNVLLANKPLAIRINESSMEVHGLTEEGEAKVALKPTCRDELYIKKVKELISGHVLGSPGGYPVYLQRWTRMGQMKDDSLEQLLMLGEPEAVVAAVCAPGLTDELARRAWWAMEDAENARQMLRKEAVVQGSMGPVLADYLVEFLPFESEPEKQIETVRLVLQPGLLSKEQQMELWRRAARRPAYYVGFIATLPDEIPESRPPHPWYEEQAEVLRGLADAGNAPAQALLRVLSGPGQAWLHTVFQILKKPSNQDVVNLTLDLVAWYFSVVRDEPADATLDALEEDAAAWLATDGHAAEVLELGDQWREPLIAVRVLSGLGYGVVRPVFGGSTAIGSLMRRKLAPIMEPLQRHLEVLSA
ncbi:MAG: sulfur reduction protein DsrS [Gammaproteobacteria bacterium]|nr:MAG: sulfur reduction protein DsrS [Gammaproteobacteria bacterium]